MVPKCLRQNVCAKMFLSKMLGAEMICAKQFFYHIQKLHKYINSSQHFVCLEAKRCMQYNT